MKHRTLAIAIVSLVFVVLMALAAAGCSRDSGGTGVEIKPTWIAAQVEGEQVSISRSEIDDGQMVHFRVEEQGKKMVFMAYRLGEKIYLRASICPPCRSESFSLVGDTLVCNACGTRFQASTGDGISGACKNYPKAEAAYTVVGDRIAAGIGDLVTAYENTRVAGLP
jgi:nitrite reductase/ring-hydroxylating ferredoxin subunit